MLSLWVQTIEKDDDLLVTSSLDRPLRLPSPSAPRSFVWQKDSKHLLFILDHDGDEIDHVYRAGADGGELKDLTPYKGVRAGLIPGGQMYPDTLLVALNLRDRNMVDAYRLELDTGKLTEVARNPGNVAEWYANNRGELVAAQAVHIAEGTTDLRVRDTEGDPWRTLATYGPTEIIGTTFSQQLVLGFTADNHRIRIATSEGAPASRLLEIDIATGKSTSLDEDAAADIGGMLVNPQSGDLEAVWRWKERRVWSIHSASMRSDFDTLNALHAGDVVIDSRDAADKRWIVSFINDTEPVVYYLYDRETQHTERLFSVQPDLERYRLAEAKPISFKSRDGLTLNGYLTLPAGGQKSLPLVIMVHGGPHLRDLWTMNGWTQLLANRGYAVLQVNFRGSMGYGKAFLQAGDRAWGKQMLDDIVDSKRWAVKEGIADPKRCAVIGFSYGGYATLAALAFAPGEFVCGAAGAAPCDLVSLVKGICPVWLTPRLLFAHRLGDAEKDRAELMARSPLYHAADISAPLLLAQGLHDARVPSSDADRLVQAMKKDGRDVQYLTFPAEGHTWARAESRIRWAEAMEKFLAKHLGGRCEESKIEDLLPRFDGGDPRLLR